MTGDAENLNAEQAADFAALQAAAAEAPAAPGQAPDIQTRDIGAEITGLIGVTVAALSPMFPSLAITYTPEVSQAAGTAIGAVCEKRGWLSGGMFGEYGEEIACLAVCGPLALATYQGVTADLAARKKPEPERIAPTVQAGAVPQAEAPANPAAKTVTFGAPAPLETAAA